MAYLFLILGFIYAFIFYIIDEILTSRSLLIESFIFAIIGIVFFINFVGTKGKGQTKLKKQESKENKFDEKLKDIFTKENFKKILSSFSYYIGFSMLYIGLYLVGKNYSFSMEHIIFGINIVTIIFFLINPKNKLSYDLLKVNSILFSIIYFYNYVNIIYNGNQIFGWLDVINSFLIVFSFLSLLLFGKNLGFKKGFDTVVFRYFFVYFFSIIYFYSYFYIYKQDIYFWFSFLSIFYGFVLSEVFKRIKIFKNHIVSLRVLGITFLYIGNFSGILYLLFSGNNQAIIFALLFSSIFNYFIHYKFQNYISFGISLFNMCFVLFFYAIQILGFKTFGFFLVVFLTSLLLVILTYIFNLKYKEDYYFVNFMSYFLNITSLILFFVYTTFSVFNFGVVLILDSLYFFASYYKIRQISK